MAKNHKKMTQNLPGPKNAMYYKTQKKRHKKRLE